MGHEESKLVIYIFDSRPASVLLRRRTFWDPQNQLWTMFVLSHPEFLEKSACEVSARHQGWEMYLLFSGSEKYVSIISLSLSAIFFIFPSETHLPVAKWFIEWPTGNTKFDGVLRERILEPCMMCLY